MGLKDEKQRFVVGSWNFHVIKHLCIAEERRKKGHDAR